jgi:GNAT superfamily N-acetyltransferase
MQMEVRRVAYEDVKAMKNLYRQEQNCQIIHDSFATRGLSDLYLILVGGRVAGYGGVSNKYDKGRLNEYYVLPGLRHFAQPMFRELLAASGATHIEAQTNNSLMLLMLFDHGRKVVAENVLFQDAFPSSLTCQNALFRAAHAGEGDSDWVLESRGQLVASGGFLTHYNPPYADVYMDVVAHARRQGFGSYIVQEIKRVCYEAGYKPAARCNADNVASRRTLEKAGMLPCGRLLVGEVHLRD